MKYVIIAFLLGYSAICYGQVKEDLPYYEIPEYPESFSAGTVAARMVDGLGFRYYWATEGLSAKDLDYKVSDSGRTNGETIDHIYGLSKFIRNSVLDSKDENNATLNFDETRKRTLMNFKTVADALRDLDYPLQLSETEVPFWNIINGPIADALWHCGQVVMLRRASGNPFNSKVSVFAGKLRE
ncbi:hypothetical protein [Cognatitamlana onchidii]|uniref:hypothetical protein n=1 Tax=Cognatitamlana onchidii TaxID=2562860 RepID=UPI0010A5A953|nr:hypothetical protein [Algibacter onchidii]